MHLRASNTPGLPGGGGGGGGGGSRPPDPAAGAKHPAGRFLPIFSLGISQI